MRCSAGALFRVFVIVAAAIAGGTTGAQAQRVLVSHPSLPNPLLSASGRFLVAVIDNRFVVEDNDQAFDLYRYSLDTNAWLRVPRAALVGTADPSVLDASVVDVQSISDDGRYVAYVVRRFPAAPGAPWPPPLLVRHDLHTGVRQVVRDAAFDPFAQPVMSRDGSTFAWVGANNAVLVGKVGMVPIAVGQACGMAETYCPAHVALTARGERVLYATVAAGEAILETFEPATNDRRRFPAFRFGAFGPLATTDSGRYVLAAPVDMGSDLGSAVLDIETGRIDPIARPVSVWPVITDDGTYVLGVGPGVHDRLLGSDLPVYPLAAPAASSLAALSGLSADGRIGLGRAGDGSTVLVDLDGDADGMFDLWENGLGLDATDPSDASLDPDGDGLPNSDEARRRTHPLGAYRRAFAEGVTGTGFDTMLHVHQPRVQNAPIRSMGFVVSYIGDDGMRVSRLYDQFSLGQPPITVPPSVRTGQYAIEVESERPIVAERITSWGGAPARGVHGTSGATPSTTWYFAEGATGSFQLFYLLANLGEVDAVVDVEYLLASGAPEVRQYQVPARSRRTVWVNQEGGPLAAAEVSARIVASHPIVAERAMYLAGPEGWGAGTASMGVPAASETWYFAEGSTGAPFDTFLLLANPSSAQANVIVDFRTPDGLGVTRTYAVAPLRRQTIWVEQERLWPQEGAFSIRIDADSPIVAERAMWWRGGPTPDWVEGHTEAGATQPAARWAVSFMPESAFLLIANPGEEVGLVRVTYYSELGGGAGSREYLVPARGRATAWPTQDNPQLPPGRYSALVESVSIGGTPPAGLVVERSAYDGWFRAGTSSMATPIP